MPAETMHEPTAPSIRSDEHDKVAKLQRELEKAQFDAQQKEVFGKYDVTAPNEGEGNYQEYIDSHSNDGIVRNGDVFQNAATGKFASEAAYAAQNGTTEDHYDAVEKVTFNGDQYKEMGVMQLAKEAAMARKDGNAAREGLITEALEHHLTMDAMKDDSESPAEAQARYESEIMRYEELVVKFAASEKKAEPPFPGGASSGTSAGEAAPAGQGAEAAGTKAEAGPDEKEVTLNGEKVTIDNVFVSPDGERVVQITAEDGTKRYVAESDLAFSEAAATSAASDTTPGAGGTEEEKPAATAGSEGKPAEADAPTGDEDEKDKTEPYNGAAFAVNSKGTATILDPLMKAAATREPSAFAVDSKGEVEVLDDDLKAQTEGIEADPRVEEERLAAEAAAAEAAAAAEKDQKFTERVKNWFQKEGKKLQEFGGAAYMGSLFEAGARGVKTGVNRMLEWRVKEDMTPEEKDKIRKQNRYGAIAFGAATAALAIGLLAANGMSNDGGPGAEDLPTPTPTETVDPNLQDILNPGGAAGGEADTTGAFGPGMTIPDWDGQVGGSELPDAAPEVIVPNEAFNIPDGGGGEQLFNGLGIDTAKWYANEDSLLANFPNDFYRMDGGHVGIARPGYLSQGAQDAINALK